MADTNYTSYDLPNYLGELFRKGDRPNTTLQLIGGTGGARAFRSWEFPVGQEYSIPDHAASRARLEGADAPDHAGVVRSPVTNVTQIWQEKILVTYTAEAAGQQLTGLGIGGETDPVVSELEFQTSAKLELIARNLNWTALNQTYNKPADNQAARRTRGLREAIVTNTVAAGGESFNLSMVDDLFSQIVSNGGTADGENMIVLAGAAQLRKMNEFFRTDKLKVDEERFVGGIRVRTVWSTFGVLNFVFERDAHDEELLFVNFDVVRLATTPHPTKGVLFREELARTGSAESYQVYGELGLDHGPEWHHGKITGLNATFGS
jgi:hypothetical protein